MLGSDKVKECLKRCHASINSFTFHPLWKLHSFEARFKSGELDDILKNLIYNHLNESNAAKYPAADSNIATIENAHLKFSEFARYLKNLSKQESYLLGSILTESPTIRDADQNSDFDNLKRIFTNSIVSKFALDESWRKKFLDKPQFEIVPDASENLNLALCEALASFLQAGGIPKIPSNLAFPRNNSGTILPGFANPAVNILYLLASAIDPSLTTKAVYSSLELRRRKAAARHKTAAEATTKKTRAPRPR